MPVAIRSYSRFLRNDGADATTFTGGQTGDVQVLLVAMTGAHTSNLPVMQAGNGWSLRVRQRYNDEGPTQDAVVELWTRVSDGSSSTYSSLSGGSSRYVLGLYSLTGATLTDAAWAGDPNSGDNSAFTDAPSVTAPSNGGLLLSVYLHDMGYSDGARSISNGMAVRDDTLLAGSGRPYSFAIAEKQVGAGSTGVSTVQFSDFGPNAGASIVVPSGNVAPTPPTLLAPVGNTTFDRTATQRFSWTFNDPNAGDTQSAHDLRYRLVGAGSWTTVSGTTPSGFRDFAGSTFAAGSYEWQVRTYDAQGLVGPYSGSEFFTAATPPPGPTITAPANNSTVSTSTAALTWSYPTQAAYQVRVLDPADAVLFDTGVVGGTAGAQTRSVSLSFPTNNVTRKLQVRVQDSGSGLWSPYSTVTVSVSYTPPAVPTLVVVPSDSTGSISVLVTHPTPTGTQPTVAATEVEVRADSAGDPYRPVGQPVRLSVNSTAYTDRAPAGGVEYAYRARAVGVNETVSLSAWTT